MEAAHSPTGIEQELCATPGVVLMFASRLPRLRNIHLSGCFNDTVCEPNGNEWGQQQWVTVGGDLALLEDIHMESGNLRLTTITSAMITSWPLAVGCAPLHSSYQVHGLIPEWFTRKPDKTRPGLVSERRALGVLV